MINIAYALQLNGSVTTGGAFSLSGNVNGSAISIGGSFLFGSGSKRYEFYNGDYEITPTQSTQVLDTEELVMRDNVTINPIPNNYGLITWNGSYLTVS